MSRPPSGAVRERRTRVRDAVPPIFDLSKIVMGGTIAATKELLPF